MTVTAEDPDTGRVGRWKSYDEIGLANLIYSLAFYGWIKIRAHEQ